MKQFKLTYLLIGLFAVAMISACSKDEVKTFNQVLSQNGGNWNLTYYKFEQFENDTSVFDIELSGGVIGTFTFAENGTGTEVILLDTSTFTWSYNEANMAVTMVGDSSTEIYKVITGTEAIQEWKAELEYTSGGLNVKEVTDISLQKP